MTVPNDSGSYIHGAGPREQARLSRLNDLINPPLLLELRPDPGARILDVGSGLGQFTRAMARAAGPAARALGIERDERQLAQARLWAAEAGESALAEFRRGDALDLPLRTEEWGGFDLAHARFVLEHVPDAVRVVRQMVRAVRPGGRIVLADDDHDVLRLWPEPPGVAALWRAYCQTYVRLGNDPAIGRKLVALLADAGASPTRNTTVFFGGCPGGSAFAAVVANLIAILGGAREAILGTGLIDAPTADAALAELGPWAQRPDAALWYVICWAEGIKPAL